MKYLLLMKHAPSYWTTGTAARDEAEEAAFTDFCAWMRDQGIRWTSAALAAPEVSSSVSYIGADAAAETREVVSGIFVLDVPESLDANGIPARCPKIEATSVEIRRIESGDVS